MPLTAEDLSCLTVPSICSIVKDSLAIPKLQRRRKEVLVRYILEHADARLKGMLTEAVKACTTDQPLKRKRTVTEFQTRKVRRAGDIEQGDYDASRFLEVPPSSVIHRCYEDFYSATSNAALKSTVCGICAREVSVKNDGLSTMKIEALPAHRLTPAVPHPAHGKFLGGMLLEPKGVVIGPSGEEQVNICGSCRTELAKNRNLPPKFSLANNLWIGQVPWELKKLTFPEQLLIAHLYPRVFVFKLYPKSTGYAHDTATLQRGMRGTVSTYDLNVNAVTDMLGGKLMPRPLTILSSVISVTYIGLGKLPKNWLRSTFRVRREVVATALAWLKANNSKYYGDIEISADALKRLPEDDVPDEILSIVRQSSDIGLLDQEGAGYVRTDDIVNTLDEENGLAEDTAQLPNERGSEGGEASSENGRGQDGVVLDRENEDDCPDVIPLSVSGSIDCDLTKITANELMAWGLANMWKNGQEGAYAVRHGREPVSDFPPRSEDQLGGGGGSDAGSLPNFFEKAFPCLFPYGLGGIEAYRPVPIDFREHVKWALQYFDRRFRKHETFPFVCFGISQRRQALASARVQMQLKTFERDARLMSLVTAAKLEAAKQEEEKGLPISDPAVRTLKSHIHATASRIQGSDQARYRLRSEIWSTSAALGPPSLWITINPSDLHDPIAQVFAGEDIDMDEFMARLGPDKDQRAKNIADDPYAAAKFFHFMIATILETLFGVKVTPAQLKSGVGVFGRVTAYFGVVESQGRGTLHLHLLVWLKNVPSSEEMAALLKTEEFRARVIAFIRANIRAYAPGFEDGDSVKKLPHDNEVTYSRPPAPGSADYDAKITSSEVMIARMEQVHTCKPRRCLVFKKGQLVCKRRAPFQLADEEFVTETGVCGPKRLYGFVNAWSPPILLNARCNNDIKLLTNGGDTKNITFYVTSYAAKKQGKNHNMSAIMAQGFAYHLSNPKPAYVDDLRDQHRLLLFRLVHTINREQELAAPMVMSYLMGWGDVFRSHSYTPIYWSSVVGALCKVFPELRSPTSTQSSTDPDTARQSKANPKITCEPLVEVQTSGKDSDDDSETVTLDIDKSGILFAKSQLTDYSCRGEELAGINFLDFFVDTYETEIPVSERDKSVHRSPARDGDEHRGPGRPRHTRVKYLPSHPKADSVQRVLRPFGHRNLPNFIGRWFPRSDDEDTKAFYCASMLALLRPWRNIEIDLRVPGETWEATFDKFLLDASWKEKRVISGLQYFHECASAATADNSLDKTAPQHPSQDDEVCHPEDEVLSPLCQGLSEEGLMELKAASIPYREELHGLLAIEVARRAKVFNNNTLSWSTSATQPPRNASDDDLQRISSWGNELQANIAKINTRTVPPPPTEPAKTASIEPLTDGGTPAANVSLLSHALANSEEALAGIDTSHLRPDQARAYGIIEWHLDQTLNGADPPPPLRMILYGEGGTGKSRVIQTVTDVFEARGSGHILVKAAYTGVAASLINGKTTHVIAGISVHSKGSVKDEAKKRLQEFWREVRYLIIDEFSMLSRSFLATLSRNIAIGLEGAPYTHDGHSFGGLNVILCGDLHQFPPVACAKTEALYHPMNLAKDSHEAKIGRRIYEEFSTVVVLHEQMRVTDKEWRDFLTRLRYGRVQRRDLAMLRSLLLQNSPIDFSSPPWADASLITPRHAVRVHWNQAASRKACSESGQRLLICHADDKIKNRALSLRERYALAQRSSGDGRRKRKDLPETIELAVGMKVMVTSNVATDLDITNGARGIISNIILNPEEPPLQDDSIATLKYLPQCILVKLTRTRATRLDGLDDGVIPIFPAKSSMQIVLERKTRTVTRYQYPITAAYCFTDYRSQGQTIQRVIVDIASPPSGKLSLFNLYVALSRSSGQETIRLLREFDDEIFLEAHEPELVLEDERLDDLDGRTKLWWHEICSKSM